MTDPRDTDPRTLRENGDRETTPQDLWEHASQVQGAAKQTSPDKDAMLRGELYQANCALLVAERKQARELLQRFNTSAADELALRMTILRQLLGKTTGALSIEPPFHCDYGYNIHIGKNFYANSGCIFLDVSSISIGDDVLIAPSVQLYTASHPLDPELRTQGYEYGAPITIGNRVWIGGASIVLPGVSIGDDTTIGAGSVVTRDIPARVVAAGNPCRVLKHLDSAQPA